MMIEFCNMNPKALPVKYIVPLVILLSSLVLIFLFQRSFGLPTLLLAPGQKDPSFEYVSPNWSKHPYTVRMDEMWQSEGINATGQNYYFFPKPAKGHKYSERFNPQSNYFQSWFGMYTIEDADHSTYALVGSDLDPQAIFDLAIADQKGWLRSFGLSQPLVFLDPSVPVNVTSIQIDGQPGWKITGRVHTNVDVGMNNPQADLLQASLSSLLKAPSTAWQGHVASYGLADLDVVCYVWYAPQNEELNVIYYTGIEFDDLSPAHHRTFSSISAELDRMAQGITVRK